MAHCRYTAYLCHIIGSWHTYGILQVHGIPIVYYRFMALSPGNFSNLEAPVSSIVLCRLKQAIYIKTASHSSIHPFLFTS